MADSEQIKTVPLVETALSPAAGSSLASAAASDGAAPVEFPAKIKRARKADDAGGHAAAPDAVPAAKAAAPAEPTSAKETSAKETRSQRPARPVGAERAARRVATKPTPAKPTPVKPAQTNQASVKPVPAKTAPIRPAPRKVAPMASSKPDTQKIKTAVMPTASVAVPPKPLIVQLKEIPMDVTNSITDAVNSAQEKAKETFSKTSAAASEYGEFAKGNVQACVESGKILASGLQEMGSKMVADSKSAFETVTDDMKALGGIKSPSDFFKLQSEILRRNFETAISYGSKNSEAMLKLTNDVIAPLTGRVTLAVDKLKKAA